MGLKFLCPNCKFQPTHKSSLVIHQATHKNLVLHQKFLHLGQTSPCFDCDYQAIQKGRLVQNHKSMHMGKQNQKGQIVYVDCVNQATHKGILVPHHKYMHIGQKLKCPHIPHHHFRSYAESEHLRLLLKNKKFSLVDLVA